MTELNQSLGRRAVIKGAGLGLVAGGICRRASCPKRRRGHRGRRDLEQRILGQEGRRALVDVPQAARRAQGRRAVAAGPVPRPWLLGHFAGVRSQRARPWRIFRDERVRPLWLRLLDHGSRELRQVRAYLRQFRHRERRRGSEGGGRSRRPRNRPAEIPFPRRVLRRTARRRLCHGGARARRPAGAGRVHLQGRGLADPDQARRAGRLLPHPQHAQTRPRHDPLDRHPRQAGHQRYRPPSRCWRMWRCNSATRSRPAPIST